ncbi:MAG: (Fe-S)-binding protein [Gemmatales bacterium]|nr:(Fe-S)-binding protein [Gemmatales bacterium]MDW8386095.1 (Fe-S)-binding protein [Gemmatales bacterium]
MRVSLMITCLADQFFPEIGLATVRLLRRLGVEVEFPEQQTCCGQPHFNSGYHADARELARHALRVFTAKQPVVVPSGSCAAMVKLEYPRLFESEPTWKALADSLAARTYELSDFLVNVLGVEDVGARFPGKATYHMACHLRPLNRISEAERLLRKVRDLELIPLERYDECCGFGGSFSVRYPEISGAMVNDKAALIEQSGADYVVSTDAGCLMNIAGCLRRRNSRVQARHLAEILASEG